MKNKELELRKKKILEAAIRSYIKEMVPVGSSLLVKKYNLNWSSATVRNIMAQLEEDGYLRQPHTSAGRIPTDKGYRYYVDNIIRPKKLSSQEESSIRQQYKRSKGIERLGEFIEKTTHIICAITQQAALVMMPSMAFGTFDKINFFRLDQSRVLVVFFGSLGMIRNVVIFNQTDSSWICLKTPWWFITSCCNYML